MLFCSNMAVLVDISKQKLRKARRSRPIAITARVRKLFMPTQSVCSPPVAVPVIPAGPVRIEDAENGGAAQAKLLGMFFAGLDLVARKTPATESGNQCKSFGG
jgi:hypothetical protein